MSVRWWREDGDEGGVGHRSGRGLGCAAGTPSGYERDGHCLHSGSTTPLTVHCAPYTAHWGTARPSYIGADRAAHIVAFCVVGGR
jgi:hypothetical protein